MARKFRDIPPCLFLCCPCSEIPDVQPAVYYCDPPYQNTTGYKTGGFDSQAFFEWCEDRVASGSRVFVSEFSAPDHWEVLWEKERRIQVEATGPHKKTDRLYEVRIR